MAKHASPSVNPSRRHLLVGALAGVGGAVVAGSGAGALLGVDRARADDGLTLPVRAGTVSGKSRKTHHATGVIRNAGAGMHSGPDTAMGISTFTVSPSSVSCGVGSMGNSPGALPGTAAMPMGMGTSGPFAMMMYATTVRHYTVDKHLHSITARGTMRSITAMGGQVVEDVLHPYICVAYDRRGERPDEFYLHFLTPFWNAKNPMATKSTVNDAWAMFGSPILFGEVNVG
jgi:hypothetical protein